jgi:hypothetical protein
LFRVRSRDYSDNRKSGIRRNDAFVDAPVIAKRSPHIRHRQQITIRQPPALMATESGSYIRAPAAKHGRDLDATRDRKIAAASTKRRPDL